MISILVALVTATATPAAPAPAPVRPELAHADALMRSGDWVGAEREWERVPRSFEMWKGLGEARLRQGHATTAMDALRAALKLQPADKTARLLLAEAYVVDGRNSDGVAILDTVLRESPGDPKALFGRANAFALASHLREAERDGRAAARAAPGDFEIWLGLGQILTWQRKFDDALSSYASAEKAAHTKPQQSRALGRQGQLRSWQKQFPQATSLYGKAVELDPRNVEAWLGLSEVLEWSGKFKEARLAVEKAAQADPYDENTHQRLELLEWAR
jgi:cytochrome c-type biogenesis protein CcmH/NrfG